MSVFHRDTVSRIDADTALLACSTLDRIDHVDAHVVHTERSATPQWWAREILEHTSVAMRTRLRMGWTMLGLGLRHGRPDTVAGWPIGHNSAEYLRLQSDSPLGLSGQLVTQVTADGVVFATFAELSNPVARRVWATVLPAHLTIVRSLVQGAADRVG